MRACCRRRCGEIAEKVVLMQERISDALEGQKHARIPSLGLHFLYLRPFVVCSSQ